MCCCATDAWSGGRNIPAGTSVATTNVNSRLITAVTCCFAQIGQPYGMGEFAYSQSSGEAIISGSDPRKGDHPYVNQVFLAYGSGPGLYGYDGWVLSGAACDGGQMRLDSIEIDESMYPIIITSRQIAKNSLGPGEWDGGPALEGEFGPLAGEMTAFWGSDGDVSPPRGVLDGMDSARSSNWKRHRNGQLEKLEPFASDIFQPGEMLRFVTCGGGGYGDPSSRDPAKVAAAANREWISAERAETAYRVALTLAENGVDYSVDEDATAALRAEGDSSG